MEQMVQHAGELKWRFGFTTYKMKGGVFAPDSRTGSLQGTGRLSGRYAAFLSQCGLVDGQSIDGLRNDYLEDPVYGLHGIRRTRERVRMPLATKRASGNCRASCVLTELPQSPPCVAAFADFRPHAIVNFEAVDGREKLRKAIESDLGALPAKLRHQYAVSAFR
ncbi:MAG: hypothetical protein ABI995_11995 [Acidobacteriota bacterium]